MPIAPLWAGWDQRAPRSLPGPLGTLSDITFPETPLRLRVQLALGADVTADPVTWSWHDITEWVRYDRGNGVRIQSGRRDESATVTTSQAFLMLDNRDGRFSRRNPTSPYYGLLSMNTPIWVEVDPGDGGHTRFQGFVNSWPKRWPDKSLNDSYVDIECSGILRRLQQNTDSKSAMKRTILGVNATTPVAYWPLEDGTTSSIVASGLPGGKSLSVSGSVNFATDDGPPGSGPLPGSLMLDQGSLAGSVTMSSSVTGWQVECVIKVPVGNTSSGDLFSWYTNDPTLTKWVLSLFADAGTSIGLDTYDESGTISVRHGVFDVDDGEYHHVLITAEQNGADVGMDLYYDGVAEGVVTQTTASVEPIKRISITEDSLVTPTDGPIVLGQIAIYDEVLGVQNHVDAMGGYDTEEAHTRLDRVCAEEAVRYVSLASTSETMGPQPVGSLMTVARECETADMGVLYEDDWGLAYQSRTERYNQSVSLALDLSQAEIAEEPDVEDDDQRVVNRWVVTRTTGSKATAEDTTGPLGSGTNIGLWDRQVTVNTSTDDQLEDQASWRLHTTTVDEDRWPGVSIALHHDPGLIGEWTTLGYGARAQIANPPSDQVAPDTVDTVIEGHAERVNQFLWGAALNTSPASPYDIAIVSDTATISDVPRVGSGTATIGADLTTTYTGALSVTSGADGDWTEDTTHFPLDVDIDGERVRLSGISGTTFTISERSINGVVKTHTTGASIKPWRTATVGL